MTRLADVLHRPVPRWTAVFYAAVAALAVFGIVYLTWLASTIGYPIEFVFLVGSCITAGAIATWRAVAIWTNGDPLT